MKAIIIICALAVVTSAQAQDRATIKGDTLMYQNQKFYNGQRVTLGYGSSSTKDFAFVWIVAGGAQVQGHASMAKEEVIVDGVKTIGEKVYLKAKPVARRGRLMIDVEGAIDNEELVTAEK